MNNSIFLIFVFKQSHGHSSKRRLSHEHSTPNTKQCWTSDLGKKKQIQKQKIAILVSLCVVVILVIVALLLYFLFRTPYTGFSLHMQILYVIFNKCIKITLKRLLDNDLGIHILTDSSMHLEFKQKIYQKLRIY